MRRTFVAIGALCLVTATAFAAAPTAPPNDAQIAAIVVAANQVDIDAGNLALSKATDKAVEEFAQRMITDHTAVNKSATELVTRLHVTPEPNAISKRLEKGGADNLAHLKTLRGAAFDKAYVDHEVAYHEAVLDALDTTLIPNAKNAELEALLMKVRPAFVAHLDHAKQIAAALGKSGA